MNILQCSESLTLCFNGLTSDAAAAESLDDREDVLEYYGSVKRTVNDRVVSLSVDNSGTLLALQSTGKTLEVVVATVFFVFVVEYALTMKDSNACVCRYID